VAELRRRLEARFHSSIWEFFSTDTNARAQTSPALIIHDEDDASVPLAQGELIAKAWRGARFIRTRGLGHNRILRDPATIETVVRFLAEGRAA
jgi:pimeloyl-ACP methyl ester carboxylesterase